MMKNIAVIVNSLRFGGAEVQTVELVNNLANRGYRVILLSLGSESEIIKRVCDKVEVVVLGKKHFLDLGVLRRLVSILKDFKLDVMFMTNSYSTLYGYLVQPFINKKYKKISVQHTTLIKGFVDRLKNFFYRKVINRMDSAVFVCNTQRNFWIQNYKIRPGISRVIYNGIDLERFIDFKADTLAVREQLGFSKDDIVIGINANLRPEKKHEDMIDALEVLTEEGYNIKLLFIGDGVRRSNIEEYINMKKLPDKIKITGFVQDVRPYLSCADISALTSVAVETFSIAILESMALGKPVVLSDIGGARELVDEGVNGYLYPAGNVDELVKAIKKIVDNNSFYSMGQKSKNKVITSFSKDVMVDRYIELISV
ncbi:MAG: glycosyltransferase [Bacillota bacterium]